MKTSNGLNKFLVTSFIAFGAAAPAWAAEGDCYQGNLNSFVSVARANSLGISFSQLMTNAIANYNSNPDQPVWVDLTGANNVNVITVSSNIDFIALDGISGTYTLSASISNFYPILQKTCYAANVTIGDGFSNAQVATLQEFILRWDNANFPADKSLTSTAAGLHNKSIIGSGAITMSSSSYGAACDVTGITAPLSIPTSFSVDAGGNFTLRPNQILGTTFSGAGTTTVKGAFTANQSLVSSITSTLALSDSSVSSGATLTLTAAQANNKTIGGTGTVSLDGGSVAVSSNVSNISASVAPSSISVGSGATFTLTAAQANGRAVSGEGATTISGNVGASADFTAIATTLNIAGSVNEPAILTITSGQGNGRSLGGSGSIAISADSSALADDTSFRGLTTAGFSFSGSIASGKTLSINSAQAGITASGAGTVSILGTAAADTIAAGSITAKRSVDGLAGADNMTGSAAADTFNGGADNDTIAGGLGSDRAVYAGASTVDSISSNGSVLTVTTSVDGSDTVSGVETLSFSNGDIVVIGTTASIADLNAALAFSSTASIYGVANFNAATPFANLAELDAIIARLAGGEGTSRTVNIQDMSADQIAAIAARVSSGAFSVANITAAEYALNTATATNMDNALTVSGITPDAPYSALIADRQLAVRNDLVSNRGAGYSVSSADTLFGKLVAFRTATQAAIVGSNAGNLNANDFITIPAQGETGAIVGRIVAVRNAMADLGSATLNGEAINVAQADAAIAAFNVLNSGGQAVILSAMNTPGYVSFTQMVAAANAAYPAAQLANLNAATVEQMASAMDVAGITPDSAYSALDAGLQLAVRTDLVNNRPTGEGAAGYASIAAADALFTKLVAFRAAADVVVDAANNVAGSADLVAADFLTGGRVIAVRGTIVDLGSASRSGDSISLASLDAIIAKFLALNDSGRAVMLGAMNPEAGDFASFTSVMDAANGVYDPQAILANLNGAVANNIVSAMEIASILPDAGYTALTSSRQVDVQTDLLGNRGAGFESSAAADALFGKLVNYRTAVQAAVDGAAIVAADFTTSEGEPIVIGRVVAVRNSIVALGSATRSGDAVSIANIDLATSRILPLNSGGQTVMLAAMNASSLTDFASMIAAANASYDPTAILANLNAADSTNIVSAMEIASILPDAAYTALDAGRQIAVQNDLISNRGSGFESSASADALFNKLVSFRTAVQAVVNGANAQPSGNIVAADFSSGGRMVAVYNAMVALGSATLNGEAINAAGALASINTFNAMNSFGQASMLATINAGGYTSFTDLVNAATAGFPAAQLANLNGAADAAQMTAAFAISGFSTDASYLALESARQSLVAQDVVRKRPSGEGYASNASAQDSFNKSVAVYTNVKTVVDSANAGTLTVAKLNGLFAALVANGGSASGDPGSLLTASDVAFSIALQSSLSATGVTALNAAYTAYVAQAGLMGSLTQVINVSAVIYGLDAADIAAFGLLEPARQGLVFTNTGVGTNDSPSGAGLRFNNSVIAYTAVKTIVDNTNAGTATVANWQALSAAIVPFGTSIAGAPGTDGLQKRDVDFTVALLSSLTTVGAGEAPSGMAVLNAQLSAAPDFGDLGAVMAAGTYAFFGEGATATLTEYGQLVADRQALVFSDLGTDNTSPSQSGARFAALTDARLAIQIAVDTANANGITDADFSAGGKMVAVATTIGAAEDLGRTLNGDPAATEANANAAIASFNVLNSFGRDVILAAINISGSEAPRNSFTALAADANAAYPAAVLANLNGAVSTNMLSAMTVANFAVGEGSAYASLASNYQTATQLDLIANRGTGFASVADANTMFGKFVSYYGAAQAAFGAANEGLIDADDFSTGGLLKVASDARAVVGSLSVSGEAVSSTDAALILSNFNALAASGKGVILGAVNISVGETAWSSYTAVVNAALGAQDRAVGRDLVAAGLSSSNSVAQINQAVQYAENGEILVVATSMDFTRLNAVAAGYLKIASISGTMVLTNDVTEIGRLLVLAAAGEGSTVNIDASGMGNAKLAAISVNIGKVDSITNLTVTNDQSSGEITNLLSKAVNALAIATGMDSPKLSALGGGAGNIATNGITGSLVVNASVTSQSALFEKVAPGDGSFVTIDAAYTVTDAASIIAYGDLKNSWSDAAIFDKVDSISNLALYSTEDAAQITALLGKSVASGAGMATAVATGMTVDMINAIAAEASLAKIAANGVSGSMSVTSLVINLDNLLTKTAEGANVSVNASGFDSAGKGVLSSQIAKIDSISNLSVDVNETDLELTALFTKSSSVAVNAASMIGAQKTVVAANSEAKVLSITNLALANSEDAGEIAALVAKCVDGSVAADASGMGSDQKGALATATAIIKISAISNLSVDFNETDAELTSLFTKSSGVVVNAATMDGSQKGVVALNAAAKVLSISNLALANSEDAGEIAALVAKCDDGSVPADASGMGSEQKGALATAIVKISAISNLSVDFNETDAELTSLFTKSSGVAVNAASMNDLQKDVLALNVLKISGITALALASSENATEIAALLGKCGPGSATANASGMLSDQKGAMATAIAKLESISNLSLDANEDDSEITALLSKCSVNSVPVNALGMSSLQKGAVATGILKVSAISSLSIDKNENATEIAALFSKSSADAVAVNAFEMDGDQKGAVAFGILKVSAITNLTLSASEIASEITALLGKVADGSASVDGTGMVASQFNAIGAAIGKIGTDGIGGTFTLDAGVTYLSAIFGKTSLAALVTVNAEGMSPAQLDEVGNNIDKVDSLINLTVVADASLSIEALTDLMSSSSNIIVIATGMSSAQLDVVATYTANIADNGVRGTMLLNKDVNALTLSALLGKTSETQATVNANASLMSNAHLSAMSSNISKVDSIVSLSLTSAQVAGEITNLLSKATAALADATNMGDAQLNALAAPAAIANVAANGISGTVLLVSGVTDASISSLMTKIPVATVVRVNGTSMNSVTLKLIVTFDAKIDSAYNLALSNDLTGAELSNLLGKSDAASATVNATNMDSAATGKLSVIAANIAKVVSGGISGSVVIDSRLAAADIGAILSKVSTAASFIGSTVAIDANGMSGAQLSTIAAAVNALSSATASSIYSMDNLTLTASNGSSVISALILITNPGEAAVVATGMDAAQLSGLGVYGAAIGSLTGTVNITSGVSAAAITAIMNTAVAAGAFVNVDPTGFDASQQAAYAQVLTSQALMNVGAELTGATGETFVKAGETVVIRVEAKNLATRAVGAQGRVNYDSSKLTFVQIRQGTGVSAGNFMPTLFPGSVAGSAGGQSYVTFYTGIDYTNDANIGQTNGIVAEIEFTATTAGFCKVSDLASLNQSFVNRLVTAATPTAPPSSISVIASAGMEVSALKDLALTGVPSGVADATDSVANISYYADAGTVLGTVVTDPGVTAANNCSSRPVSIAITYPNSSTGSTWPARFPVGTSRVTWSSSDEAGNTTSASRDIVVINKQLMTVDVNMDGFIHPSISYTQSIRFRLSSGDVVNATVSYSGSNGTALDVEVPVRDDYTCVSAKESVHTLAASQSMPVVGTKYVPSSSFSLRGGDSNDDNVIDILDFGIFVTDRSVAGSTPKNADSRSNFDRNPVVNTADFTFISNGFLMSGDTCGGGYVTGNNPIARISVKELRRRGLGEVARGDLNGDGWVDQLDVALAAEGRYRDNSEPSADDAEAVETPNW